jgi:hypothetical protein
MTDKCFGVSYFDRLGEIQAAWHYSSHETYIRLIAGLAFGSEELLGYDSSMERNMYGKVVKIRVNSVWYSVLDVVFSSGGLSGRGGDNGGWGC